jgi:hypothetical protein
MRRQRLKRLVLFVAIVAGLYTLLRLNRSELVDFVVPRTAAMRFVAHEPLYRPDDGHYQYKYLPAFAALFVPFTWLGKEPAQLAWFSLLVAMTWAFLRMSLAALPDRRLSEKALLWFTLLLNGKFLVKELAFGQFNLPVGMLMLGAVMAAQRKRKFAAGALVAAGVFVKPYALVLVPWLFLSLGWRPFVPFAAVMVAGLLLPVASYGWTGNLDLLHGWYRTVTDTIAPNLMGHENISFASMWAKWIGPGEQSSRLALVSSAIAVAAGMLVISWRRGVSEPYYLEAAYFFVFIPLLSPQGWDYVLILALPAYMLLVDRYRDLSPNWRIVVLTGFLLTSFTIFDLLRRGLYIYLMEVAGPSIGAVLIAACLMRLRWRKIA